MPRDIRAVTTRRSWLLLLIVLTSTGAILLKPAPAASTVIGLQLEVESAQGSGVNDDSGLLTSSSAFSVGASIPLASAKAVVGFGLNGAFAEATATTTDGASSFGTRGGLTNLLCLAVPGLVSRGSMSRYTVARSYLVSSSTSWRRRTSAPRSSWSTVQASLETVAS
jgi:hypothetical protein